MSQPTVAAFLRRIRETPIMRAELARMANRYGYQISPDDFADIELRTGQPAGKPDNANAIDDEPTDPGFGIIEVPA